MKILAILFSFLFSVSAARATVIFSDDFEANTSGISGWGTIGSRITLHTVGCYSGTKCVKASYSPGGVTADYQIGKNVSSSNLSDIYIQFKFKTDAYADQGAKFLKLYNVESGYTGYARSTFALQYASGNLYEVSYGDGSGTTNDTQASVRYDGSHPLDPGANIITSTSAFNPSDHQWHTFEARAKYNTDGNRDGLYQVWIDGVLRLSADNIKNRNNLNSRLFESVQLANYNNGTATSWGLYYDDVVISDSPVGYSPPADIIPPIVTASPDSNSSASLTTVTLSSNETTTIYYTIDGSTPTTSSAVYSAPLSVKPGVALKYFGKDTAGNESTVQTSQYKWRQVCR